MTKPAAQLRGSEACAPHRTDLHLTAPGWTSPPHTGSAVLTGITHALASDPGTSAVCPAGPLYGFCPTPAQTTA